jgi:hypothetical protein
MFALKLLKQIFMKKLIAIILFSAIGIYSVKAQDEGAIVKAQDEGAKGGLALGKQDELMFNFYTDLWQNVDPSIKVSAYSPGFDVYCMHNIPFGKKSKFGFRLGIGLGTQNLHSNATPTDEIRHDSVLGNIKTGNTIFERIPDYVNNKEIKYDINKLTLTYFDIPLELRYKTENKNGKAIKFAIGFKTGYLLISHTKYKGDDLSGGDFDVKYKTYKIKNLEPLRYGATIRFGYGVWNIFGYYSLSKIFKADKGPEMYPISIGICITPF